jgi:hypothetical protein
VKRGKARLRLAVEVKRAQAAEAEALSLVHTSMDEFEADDRLGAKLVRPDGTVLTERVKTPERYTSFATRSVWPPPRGGSAGQFVPISRPV